MQRHSKITVVVLALSLGLPMAFAQNTAPETKPGQPDWKGQPPAQGRGDHASADRQGSWNREAWRGQGQRMGMHRRSWGERDFMLARLVSNPSLRERLGITPEQASKIRTRVSDFRKTQIRNGAELQVKHLELNDLLSADKPDRGAIDKTLQEISALRLSGEKAAIDFRLAMRDALTPEQRQKLMQMRQERFRRGGPGRGMPAGPRAELSSPDTASE
jgi:Spy/CpxP family protein refolding chaperone